MSRNDARSMYAAFRCFRLFFESREAWEAERGLFGFRDTIPQRDYDDFLKGTDAALSVPLWASACKNAGRVLVNEITFEVIRFYRAHGYTPILMDGNPADYLGEQFRFLEYLARGELETPGRCQKPIADFLQAFTLDTVRAVCSALDQSGRVSACSAVVGRMARFVKGEPFEFAGDDSSLRNFDSWRWRIGPPLSVEDERLVRSAGINNCGGKCRIDITVREGCVLNLEADTGEKTPRIQACVRGKGYRRTFLNTDRLRYPMKRLGRRGEGRFKRISWDEAIDEIARETSRIKNRYGAASRFVIYATGLSAAVRADKLMKNLLALDGGYLGTYNSYSSACATYTVPFIYGNNICGSSVEDLLNTRFLILWGHNPAETLFGSFSNFYLTELKRKGVRVAVIDPRRSDSAIAYGDQWIGLRPSTDAALADAMAYVIWSEGLQDQAFMDEFCVGFDEAHLPEGVPAGESYYSYLFGLKDGVAKTPSWAERVTGVPAGTISGLAREYAITKPACILPGLGQQRTGNGEQACRALAMLSCLTGNVGVSGGGSGCYGPWKAHATPQMPVVPNPYPGTIPTFLWSKAVAKGTELEKTADGLKGVEKLDSNIKLIFNLAGNTLVNQHSNINETIGILEDESKCEFIVVSDILMTPSAKFADILLPSPSVFESDNIAYPWLVDNYLLHNTKAIEPLFECRFEYEWMKEVARKLGHYDAFTEGHETVGSWLEYIYEKNRTIEKELLPYDQFKTQGGWQYDENTLFVAYREERETGKPFPTPSGKIEIFSKTLFDMGNPAEIPGIPRYVPCPEGPDDPLRSRFPLQLIGYHTKRRCHSIHDNNDWMEEIDPPALWIHPDDAAARGIRDGEAVDVFNDRGAVRIPAKVADRIVKGVVALSQGGWYTPGKDGVDRRGSINVLTSTSRPSPLAKGNPQHTNLVEVRKAAGA